jgi:hypothetical protein
LKTSENYFNDGADTVLQKIEETYMPDIIEYKKLSGKNPIFRVSLINSKQVPAGDSAMAVEALKIARAVKRIVRHPDKYILYNVLFVKRSNSTVLQYDERDEFEFLGSALR